MCDNYKKNLEDNRPVFPKRAVITAGMPYGNKELHFGHVGGMFVHSDTFARFLRDRIGSENVIFVSGTDCYGSPILESYRKLSNEENQLTIEDYVEKNHIKQKEVLDKYEISLDFYGASALKPAGEIHEKLSSEIFHKLYEKGYLDLLSTPQFFDPEHRVLLNGRQVIGRCPIEGCNSEQAYSDECALGHQYMPSELIDPKSTLSGKTPEVIHVSNWYFKLEDCMDILKQRNDYLRRNTNTRKYILNAMEEFLKLPMIYVQKKQVEDLDSLLNDMPKCNVINEEKKPSYTFVFDTLKDRDVAREVLAKHNIRFRTGKTLVPFRLSGNITWGVKVPAIEGVKDLTFWVWPESLWAPISFTKTYLEEKGMEDTEWKNWWLDKDAKVYQFMGEDNIYFYGIAEMAMFARILLNNEEDDITKINLPELIANNHVLFLDKKASSSSSIKPPMAKDLLDFYTPEQLRMHFLSLGLANKSVSFAPKVYLPEGEQVGVDTVLKEGNLLTNVFNRIIRTYFYTLQKFYDGVIPTGKVSDAVVNESKEAILKYEMHMYRYEFHSITYVLDSYIRFLNKHQVNNLKEAENNMDESLRKQILTDCLYGIKTALLLLHPIAPTGCDLVREYLNFSTDLWNWDNAFLDVSHFIIDNNKMHKFLEPKFDFFKKHESQLMDEMK